MCNVDGLPIHYDHYMPTTHYTMIATAKGEDRTKRHIAAKAAGSNKLESEFGNFLSRNRIVTPHRSVLRLGRDEPGVSMHQLHCSLYGCKLRAGDPMASVIVTRANGGDRKMGKLNFVNKRQPWLQDD